MSHHDECLTDGALTLPIDGEGISGPGEVCTIRINVGLRLGPKTLFSSPLVQDKLPQIHRYYTHALAGRVP